MVVRQARELGISRGQHLLSAAPGPLAVAYVYAPNRKVERPIVHLQGFAGILPVDGYGGYKVLAEKGDVKLAFCGADVRRRFYELAAAGPAPIATEMLERIAALYRIEAEISMPRLGYTNDAVNFLFL